MWPFPKRSDSDSEAVSSLHDTLHTQAKQIDALNSTQRQQALEMADLSDRLKRALGRWSQEKKRHGEAEPSEQPRNAEDINELIRQGLYRG